MTDPSTAELELQASRRSLDKSLIGGIGWTGGMRWLTQLISWAATLVIARLLSPAAYGLVGMAVVYNGLVELVSDMGLGVALVQRRNLDRGRIAQVGGLAVGLGVGFFAVSVLVARPIAAFYDEPAVAGIIMVLSVNFILAGLQLVPQSLMVRDLRFRELAWLRGAEALSLTLFTITLAMLGMGYWALALGVVGSKLTSTTIALAWRPHRLGWPFPLKPIAAEITFGWQLMVSNIAWYVYNNADFAIVGRVLGKVVLGAYTIAWSFASVPVERISALLGDVFRGIFSAVQNDSAALARYLCILTEGLAIVTFPLAAGLALVADDAVRVLLGDHWLGAIEPLRLLALYAMIRSVATLFAPILVATGHTRLNMRFNLVAAVVMPALFLGGTRWGPTGVATAWIVGYSVIVVTLFLREVLRIVQLSPAQYLRSLLPATVSTAAMTVVVALVRSAGPGAAAGVHRLVMEVAAGAATYVITLWLVHGHRLRRLADLLQETRARPAVADV